MRKLLDIGPLLRSYNMYKQIKLLDGTIVENQIKRVIDNSYIPFNPDNTDYQAYLKWVSEGNTPEQADNV